VIRYSYNSWNHSSQWGLPPSLPEQIKGAAAAGYDHIGLDVPSLLDHERDGTPPQHIAELMHEAGISCYELVPLRISTDAAESEASLADALRLAPLVGASQALAVVHSGMSVATVDATRHAVTAMADIGVGVSIEFIPTLEIDSLDRLLELIDAVGHPELRVDLDSWHFFEGPSTWEALDAMPMDRLGFVQFGDAAPHIGDDLVYEYRQRRVLPGEGVHDLRRFCDTLLARTDDFVVSVEILSAVWRARPPAELAAASLAASRPFFVAAPSPPA
jgi:sugar phosphate isomerase/epimerase